MYTDPTAYRHVLSCSISNEGDADAPPTAVLTAAVVVLSIGAISALNGGISGMITSINAELSYDNVASQQP